MVIETNRLLLRPFTENDIHDLYEYLKEISIHCFLDMKIDSIDEARESLKERIDGKPNSYFAIELKSERKVIGEVFGCPEDTSPSGEVLDNLSPCWLLNSNYRNQGYMFEVISAYFDFLFNQMNIRRIYTYTEDYNIPCQKLCKKLGMRQEGFYKEFVSFIKDDNGNNVYENTLEFAILKKEWNENK